MAFILKEIKVTPKKYILSDIYELARGERLHIIDFICELSDIWHAAGGSVAML